MVLSKVIKEHITRNGENKIYTVSDFADLNNDMLVTRVLSRLKEEQFLIRLSQGIYLYPSRNTGFVNTGANECSVHNQRNTENHKTRQPLKHIQERDTKILCLSKPRFHDGRDRPQTDRR